MSLLVNTPDSDNLLVRRALRAWTVPIDMLPTVSIAPYSLKFTSLRNIHSLICAAQRLHAQTSVTSYTSVNIYNLNSCLAHLHFDWNIYVRFELESWRNIRRPGIENRWSKRLISRKNKSAILLKNILLNYVIKPNEFHMSMKKSKVQRSARSKCPNHWNQSSVL